MSRDSEIVVFTGTQKERGKILMENIYFKKQLLELPEIGERHRFIDPGSSAYSEYTLRKN